MFIIMTIVHPFSLYFFYSSGDHRYLHSFPTRRSSDLLVLLVPAGEVGAEEHALRPFRVDEELHVRARAHQAIEAELLPLLLERALEQVLRPRAARSEEHTSELQSHSDLVCRLLLEKKK